MKKLCISFFAVLLSVSSAIAHELTPTYFVPKPSLYRNVSLIQMSLFNRREDIQYYEITAFDEEWNPIKFVSKENIINVKYLETKNIELYFRNNDLDRLTYICTKSLIVKDSIESSGVTSRICSKQGVR
jgi:hypothetical protein